MGKMSFIPTQIWAFEPMWAAYFILLPEGHLQQEEEKTNIFTRLGDSFTTNPKGKVHANKKERVNLALLLKNSYEATKNGFHFN